MSLSVMEVVLPYLTDALDGFSTLFNVALIVSAKRYHHSGVSGTIVSLEAVPL